MYTIAKRFAFSASHVIGGLPPNHPCARLHGHNYEVEVILQSPTLDAVGFVRDFHELSALRDFINATLDHTHLNDVLGHDRTTTEVISRWLYDWCTARWPEITKGWLSQRATHRQIARSANPQRKSLVASATQPASFALFTATSKFRITLTLAFRHFRVPIIC
jgi:6-pyruvoyltetrahydropterin/6-carboxytetrahydropterin synthase